MKALLFSILAIAQQAAAVTISDPGQGIFNFTAPAPGLSGLTYVAGNDYYAVNDSAAMPSLRPLTITLTPSGTISGAQPGSPIPLAAGYDHEDIAFHPERGTVFISDEGNHPDGGYVREFSLPSGALVGAVALPAVLQQDRPSLGLEPLSFGAGFLWTANEEALTHESQPATETEGSTIRLQRFGGSFSPAGQWAYETDPASSSGASGMLALPNGHLLVLERAFGLGTPSTYRNRIYLVDFAGATDISAVPDLDDFAFTPVGKTLLWERNMGSTGTHNFEGITLGPPLDEDSFSVLLIADNASGSQQHLYPLLIHGVPEPAALALVAAAFPIFLICRFRGSC